MCRQNHGVAVDYFAVGVMAYEFMMGRVRLWELSDFLETLYWKVEKRDQGSDPGEASPD